jgi:hypothetical protein
MRTILEQLINEEVRINTVANVGGDFNNVTVNSVSRGLVTVIAPNEDEIVISICDIVGVASPALRTVELVPPPRKTRTGDCACCERPWRVFFNSIIGNTVDVLTQGTGALTNIQNATVLRTGEGIVILDIAGADDVAAISLCKIISVSDVTPPTPPTLR